MKSLKLLLGVIASLCVGLAAYTYAPVQKFGFSNPTMGACKTDCTFSGTTTFTTVTTTNLIAKNATTTNIIWTNATGTNTTSTNLFATNSSSTNASFTQATSGWLGFTTASGTSVNGLSGTINTLTATNGTIAGLNWTNATGINSTSSNLFATTAAFTSASATNVSTTYLSVLTSLTPITNAAVDIGAPGLGFNNTYSSGTNIALKFLTGTGSASAPSFSFTTDTDTGFFENGANSLRLAIGGTATWQWDSAKMTPLSNNSQDIGTTSIAIKNFYASGTSILLSGLPAPSVTEDLVCWKSDGTLGHQATNCIVSSAWFKENIKTLSVKDLFEKVRKLRAVEYDLKSDGKHEEGFVAEEIARIDPSLVVYESSTDNERIAYIQKLYPDVIVIKDSKTFLPKTIDYARITVLLTGAIQMEDNNLTALEVRVSALEARKK